MAEYAAIPSCAKLQLQRSYCKLSYLIPKNACFGTAKRRHSFGNCRISFPSSAQEFYESCGPITLKRISHVKERSLRCCCFGTLINPEIATPSNGLLIVDQVLLMASVILAYMAGVVPAGNVYFTPRKNGSDRDFVPDDTTSSGSSVQSDHQVNVEFSWNVVREKLLGALDAIEYEGNLDSGVVEHDKHSARRPLSLYAIAEGPRLRLLCLTLQRLEKEVSNISEGYVIVGRHDRLAVISEIIQKSSLPVFNTWLEEELSLEKRKHDKEIFPAMYKKLEGDDTILQNIKRSGKEDLYAEFLFLLRFRSLGVGCRYDINLFTRNGVDILEDLVINLADGITSNYLELISVDSNMSNEMNRLGLVFCSMSTRELQRLRNEVALNKWMHQNMESVISMYEDRFDLCTFGIQLLEDPNKSETMKLRWWQKLILKKPASATSMLQYVVISQLSMAVKRTEELRSLSGWRYYFSLFLELSDITMPFAKSIVAKVSSAISFFLVSLIGRSLGLIYTGIRQSLGWRNGNTRQ